MLATWHWHIEISSKCTLKCPRCARQEVPDSLVNTELDLDFFKKAFTPEFIKTNVEKITFCGDDGDPIYAHELLPVIRYFKGVKNIEIVIVTNGSYKKMEWWSRLGELLDAKDSIHFSLDGYDYASNNIYRANSDFNSAVDGIRVMRSNSDCQIIWDAIAFKFNEDKIDRMKSLATSLGVDRFQLTKSTKFGSIYNSYGVNDPLEPNIKFISSSHRFEREVTQLTSRLPNSVRETNVILYNKHKDMTPVVPLCSIGNKGLYLNSRGQVFPCCWVANRYNHNSEWQEIAKQFNLHNRSMENLLSDPFWETTMKEYKWHECKTKCSSKLVDKIYATAW